MKKLFFFLFAMVFSIAGFSQTYLTESFEGSWYQNGNPSTPAADTGRNAPSGWTQTRVVNGGVPGGCTGALHDWGQSTFLGGAWSSTSSFPIGCGPYGGSPATVPNGNAALWFYDGNTTPSGVTRLIYTPAINLSTATRPIANFYYSYAGAGASTFMGSLDGGTTWTSLGTIAATGSGVWVSKTIVIPAAYKIATAKFGFQIVATYGSYDVFIDFLSIREFTQPAAPTTFAATSVKPNSMYVNWTDNSTNESVFRVFRSTNNVTFTQQGSDINSTTVAGTGTVYSQAQTGLLPDTTYYYRVAAFTDSISAYLTGTQAAASLLRPTTFTKTGIYGTSATIGWTDASTTESAFRIYRSATLAGTYTLQGTDIPTTDSTGVGSIYTKTLTGLTANTKYYYRIMAAYGTAESPFLQDSITTTPMQGGDAAPINFTASNITSQSVTIGWTDNSTNETSFRVFRSTDTISANFVKQGNDIPSTSTVGTGTSYSLPQINLIGGTTYYYKIASVVDSMSAFLPGTLITSAAVPMSGIWTINPAGSGSTNFTTFGAAMTYLNANGVGVGGLTFNCSAGMVETLTTSLSLTATGTSTRPIIFQRSGAGANPKIIAYTGGTGTPGSALQDGIWRLVGSDYVTIDGIDLSENVANTTNPSTMEYGFGFYKINLNDGCQYNTIKNCVVTLNRINNAGGSSPAVDGSVAINMMNATYAANTTALVPTLAAGGNSYNKFYSNTVQNANIGIAMIGYAAAYPFIGADYGNDIGGASLSTGNTIKNFGGGDIVSPSAGIRTLAQYDLNIAYNTLNNNDGSGVNHASTLRGIYLNTALGASSSITNNTLTIKSAVTTSQVSIIENLSGGASIPVNTVKIRNNTITNCANDVATTSTWYGIYNTANPAKLIVNYNTFTANTTKATSGGTNLIYSSGSVALTDSLCYNQLSFNHTGIAGYTGTIYSVYNTAAANSCSMVVNNNNFSNYNFTVLSAAVIYYNYLSGGTPLNLYVSNNTWTNLNLKNNGSNYLNYFSLAVQGGIYNFTNNVIAGSYMRTADATAGTLYCYYKSTTASLTGTTYTISDNDFSNITANLLGSGTFYGFYDADPTLTPYSKKQIFNNVLSNNTYNTSGTLYGLYVTGLGDGNTSSAASVHDNTISSITTSGPIYGLYLNTTVSPNYRPQVYNNNINSLTSNGAASGVYGVYAAGGGAGIDLYQHNVYALTANGATGLAYGISIISSGLNSNFYNNFVSQLYAPFSTGAADVVRGFNLTSATALSKIGLYYNTVYLDAVSTGAIFNNSALFHTYSATATTAALDMRNNIFVNNSANNGAGIASAFRRSAAGVGNLTTTTNNNCFFAGSPNANHLIYYDATNSDQFMSTYQSRVASRDAQSFTENPPFTAAPGDLTLSTSGPTQCESGGSPVANITTDFYGTPRNATTPDVGANEGAFIISDLYPPTIAYTPLLNSGTTTNTLVATITDASGVPTTGTGLPVLYWKKNVPGTFTPATATSIGSDKYSFTFGSGAVTGDSILYYVVAQDINGNTVSNPSVGATGFAPNPPSATTPPTTLNMFKMLPSMSGIYTIDSTQLTGGTNFMTFIAAVNALNAAAISGPVTFNVVAGQSWTFTTAASPNNYGLKITNPTTTAVNTVTFQKFGAGANPVLNITGTAATNDMGIWLYGSDYITFDGIDIKDAGTSTSNWVDYGFYLNGTATDGCNYNTYKNGNITLTNANLNANGVFLNSAATVTSGANSHNKFYNNTVSKVSYGYKLVGKTGTGLYDVRNEIGNQAGGRSMIASIGTTAISVVRGLDLAYQDSLQFFNTLIDTIRNTGATSPNLCGVQMSSPLSNFNFYGDTIRQVNGNEAYGINFNTCLGTNYIRNCLFTEFNSTSGNSNILRDEAAFLGNMYIYNNEISNIYNATGGIEAVYLNSSSTFYIYNNNIHGFNVAGAAVTANAINCMSSSNVFNIYNNMIYDIKAPASSAAPAVRGIRIGASTTVKFYYNTIYLDYTTTTASGQSACIYADGAPLTLDIRNNIIVNKTDVTTGTKAVAFWYTGSAPYANILPVCNNNIYYCGTPSAKNLIFFDGTNSDQTLSAFVTRLGNREQASFTENPPFISNVLPYNLHMQTSVPTLTEGRAQVIAGYTTDIDGNTRNVSTPDMGADEFTGTPATNCSGTPAANSIIGVAAVCYNLGTTLALNTAISDLGVTHHWGAATVPGGPYTGLGVINTQATGNLLVNTYYVDTIQCSFSGLNFITPEKSVLVNALPLVNLLPATALFCSPGSSPITLTASGASTYLYSPTAGLDTIRGTVVHASPSTTTTYIVTGTDLNGCINTKSSVITVKDAVTMPSVTALPSIMCVGGSSVLTANASIPILPSSYAFTGTSGTYTPISGTVLGANAIGDDVGIGNLPIGFTFNYNGINQTVFAASSNGLLLLGNTTAALSGFSSNALASNANAIAPFWDDNNTTGGSIQYLTTGTPGNQVLTVQWTDMHVAGSGSSTNPTISVQALLYEATGNIQFIYGSTSAALSSPTASIGISGNSGVYLSVTPLLPVNTSTVSSASENSTISSATNVPSGTIYSFAKPSALTYLWSESPIGSTLSSTTTNPTNANIINTTTIYTVTASSAAGCAKTASVTVTVSAGAAITTQPSPSSTCLGSTASLTVVATGPGLTYQWRKDGINIPIVGNASAGTATLILPAITATDIANYDVVLTSTCGVPLTSSAVGLTIKPVPTVSASGTTPICSGSTLLLTGTTDIGTTYAWTGPNGFTSSLQNPTVTSTTTLASGNYLFSATLNGCTSSITSTTVQVNQTPSTVAIAPSSSTICNGSIQSLVASGGTINATGTIGTATSLSSSSGYPTVFGNYWYQSWQQFLYTSAELNALGITAGNITSIALNTATMPDASYFAPDFTINVGTTANTALTGFTTAGLTTTYGPTTVAGVIGWNTFNFSTPFVWDGVSNIIIDIRQTEAYGNGNATTYYTTTTSNTVASAYASPSNSSFWTSSPTASLSTSRPNLKITGQIPTTVVWTPITDLYSDAAATIAYVGGSNANTVYAKPASGSPVYTATASASGCSRTSTATVTVNPPSVGGTTSAAAATICAGTGTTINLSGYTGSIHWQSSLDSIVWTNVVGETSASLLTGNLSATTYYQANVNSGVCAPVNSTATKVNVDPISVGGLISGAATVCSGSNSTALTLSGKTGNVVKWQSSLSPFTTWSDISNTTTAYTATNLTATAHYRAIVLSGICSQANSDTAIVTVHAIPTAAITPPATICAGDSVQLIVTLTGTPPWNLIVSNGVDGNMPVTGVATSPWTSWEFPTVLNTYSVQSITDANACTNTSVVSTAVPINPTTAPGSVTGGATVCSGTNSTLLTLGTHTGTIVRWESSLNGTTWTPISNTLTTYTATNLTATTQYRAVVQSGVCPSANSVATSVTVDPVSEPGSVSGGTTVCSGINSTLLTLGTHIGAIVRWESSLDGTTWTTIANTTANYTALNITATTQYRAVVQNGVCSSANSIATTVIVDPVTVAGTVTGGATVCTGTNSTLLTLGTHTGNIVRWESSLDGTTWTPILNTLATFTATNLIATTQYRAVVHSGVCSIANSISTTVTVDPATIEGTVSGGTTVCSGTNSTLLTLGTHTGAILRWESSLDGTTWTTIANTTATFTALNITATTQYRAVVQSGVCSSANSVATTVNVDPVTVSGTVTGGATVCTGTNSTLLTLGTHTGNVVRWESSLDGTTWTPIANTLATYTATNLTVTTQYRAVVQSGVCASANSVATTVTVNPVNVGGTLSSNTSLCSTTNSTLLTLTGNTGAITRWESSINGTVWTPISNTIATYTATNVAVTTQFRVVVQTGVCNAANSSIATITINTPPAVSITSSTNPTVCAASNGTATVNSATSYSWATIPVQTTQTATGLAAGTYFVTISNGTCSNTTSVTLSDPSAPTVTIVSNDSTICAGTSTTFTAGGATTFQFFINGVSQGAASTTTTFTTTAIANNNVVTVRGVTLGCTGNSTGITMLVSPVSNGGNLSGAAAVCSNANSTLLTLNSYTGAIVRWESSLNGTSWSPIVNTANTYTATNLTATTHYRAVVQNGYCGEANSSEALITVTPLPTSTISYAGTPYCKTVATAQAVTHTGTTGGAYSAASGLTIDVATGGITPSTSTAGTYTVTYTIAAAGGCAIVTATTAVTINTAPVATIAYSGTPFCKTVATAQTVTQTGTTGGAYSAPTGLTIDVATGGITPSTSTAGTYTVTYTIAAAGGCAAVTATASVVITAAPVATIAYAGTPYCTTLATAQTVTLTGSTGGAFTAPTGLTINAGTGSITPSTSTAGTYTVTYTIAAAGGCAAVTATTSVVINAAPVATIAYAGTPFCTTVATAQSVTQTGTTAGAYTAPTGLTINAGTGAIIPSTSTAGTYTVTYTIAAAGGCAAVTATASVVITAAPVATIAYAGTPFCTTLATAQAVTLTGSTGGVYTAPTGLTINAGTGAITPSTSTAGTYTVTYTIAAAGGCAAVTATTSVVITAAPIATIAYAGTPYCKTVATAQSVTQTGTTAGVYTAPTGLTINAGTGAITPSTSTAGTYTVTYTIAAAGGCAAVTATASVVITAAPVATIAYAGTPYCTTLATAQTVTLTGSTGGAFTAPTGLTINAGTGSITPSTSTAGTYTVTYTIAAAGGCAAVTATTSVVINAAPVATIAYAGTPFCTTVATAQTVTLTGSTGGAYTAPTGLSINAGTGAITPSTSTAGTYTVTYTIAAAGGCAAVTATSSVVITAAPVATIAYAGTPYCKTVATAQSVTQTGTAGGVYTAATGLTINAANGAITPSTSTAGTYTVTYTIAAAGGCAAVVTTTSVVINTAPTATISYTGTPYCTSASPANVTFTGTTGGTYTVLPSGLTINASTGTITPATSSAGTYTVTYTIAAAGGCAAVLATTSVTLNTAPVATIAYAGTPYCTSVTAAQTVTLTGNSGGVYSAPTGLTINAATGSITPSTSTAGTYTVTYTIAATGSCAAIVASASVTITAAPTATIAYAGNPFCTSASPASVTLTGNAGGTYTVLPSGLSINASTGVITPATSTAGTYTVTYTIAAAGGCAAVIATTSVTLNTAAVATIAYAGTPYCTSVTTAQAVTLTGTSGGVYSAASGLSISAATGAITPSTSTAGTYTVTYTIAATGSCGAIVATASVVITAAPTATIAYAGTPFCKSITTAQAVTLTGTTGGTYTSTTGLSINVTSGAITPNTSTAGTYTVTYTIAAAGGCAVVTKTTLVTITAAPTATISYAGSPFCKSVTSAQAVTLVGTTGGTYTSTTGLTLNGTTGAVTPSTSTVGTYSVTYTIAAAGGCSAVTANALATILPLPDAATAITSINSDSVSINEENDVYYVAAIANATSYVWAYSGTGANFVNGSVTTSNNVLISFTSTATSGNLTVKGYNNCGYGTVSANYPIWVSPVGIGEIGNSLSYKIYPNPTKGLITITINGINSSLDLQIVNIQGQLIHTEKLTIDNQTFTQNIDLSTYPKGIYFVKLTNKNFTKVEKVVLQ